MRTLRPPTKVGGFFSPITCHRHIFGEANTLPCPGRYVRLTVSTAAVSKWAARNTYPDITMLLPLADVLGVTVDDLFGYDEAKARGAVDSIVLKYQQLFIEGNFVEAREWIRNARKKYPHDFRIMNKYMWDLAGGKAKSDTDFFDESFE